MHLQPRWPQQDPAADTSPRSGAPAPARDDRITEHNHIGERLFPHGRGRLNKWRQSDDLRAMRAWHPAAATCASWTRRCAGALLRGARPGRAPSRGCRPFLSSTSSPRFLSPSRRVRRTQSGGKDSKRTVDGVEIEVERGTSRRLGKATKEGASKRQVEQRWPQSWVDRDLGEPPPPPCPQRRGGSVPHAHQVNQCTDRGRPRRNPPPSPCRPPVVNNRKRRACKGHMSNRRHHHLWRMVADRSSRSHAKDITIFGVRWPTIISYLCFFTINIMLMSSWRVTYKYIYFIRGL
jgi:hypothetical protein